jgi:hypothetical protein
VTHALDIAVFRRFGTSGRAALAWAIIGLVSGLAMSPEAARAQSQFETITTISPPTASRPVAPRSRQTVPAIPQNAPNPFVTRVRPVEAEPAINGAPSFPGDSDADPAPAQPRAPVDGDFSTQPTQTQPIDGDLTIRDTVQPTDGVDPANVDQRSETERADFDGAPAGYDPQLFSIDVSPILSQRPRQLFQFEPYAPLGIRAGGFVIFPEIEATTLADSNVFQAEPSQGDIAVEVLPSVRIVSNWSVHALEFRANGAASWFKDFDSENDREYRLEARGRLDITRFTNVEGLISRSLAQESRSGLDGSGPAGDRADVVTHTAAATLNHRFNRLRVQLRGSVTQEDYASSTVPAATLALRGSEARLTGTDVVGANGTGAIGSRLVTVTNDDQDQRSVDGATRLSWEFKPTLFAFAEVALNRTTFEAASSEDGVSRDSRGERYRVGLNFGNTDQILRGEISVGFGQQRPDDAGLETIQGVLLDANLAWRVSGLTTMLFTAGSDFNATTTEGSAGSLVRRFGVEARHAFRTFLIGTAGIGYQIEDFEGISVTEREFQARASLEYFASRELAVISRYQFTNFDGEGTSDLDTNGNPVATDRDYRDHEFRIGLRWRR